MPTYNIYMNHTLMDQIASFAEKQKITVSKAVQGFCIKGLEDKK